MYGDEYTDQKVCNSGMFDNNRYCLSFYKVITIYFYLFMKYFERKLIMIKYHTL